MTIHPLLLYVFDFSFNHPFEIQISHHFLSAKNFSVNHKQLLQKTDNKLKIIHINCPADFTDFSRPPFISPPIRSFGFKIARLDRQLPAK
jgi:hypothetical protein